MALFRASYIALTVSLVLAGCGTRYGSVGDRFEAHNTAVANAENRVIALNVVRQAYRAPLHFTLLRTAQDGDRFSGTVTGQFPFGGLLSEGGFLNSRVTANDPHPTLNYEAENTSKFEKGISSAVSPTVISTLIDQGLPPELVYTLLVERIDVTLTSGEGASAKIDRYRCTNEPRTERRDLFETTCYGDDMSFDRVLRALLARGLVPATTRTKTRVSPPMDKGEIVAYINGEAAFGQGVEQDKASGDWFVTKTKEVAGLAFDKGTPRLACQAVGCDAFLNHLDALVTGGKVAVGEMATSAASAPVTLSSGSSLPVPEGENPYRKVRPQVGSDDPETRATLKIEMTLRSVRGVFAYLGEIAADQMRGDAPLPIRFAGSPLIYPKLPGRGSVFQEKPLVLSFVCDPETRKLVAQAIAPQGVVPQAGGGPGQAEASNGQSICSVPAANAAAGPSDAVNEEGDKEIKRGAILAKDDPHLLFVLCRAADRAQVPGTALVTVTFDGQTFYVPSDRGSTGGRICGVDVELPLRNAQGEPYRISDNRSGETMQVLLQLLALNRDATELSQTLLAVGSQ